MQRLTAMTLGALAIGLAGYAYDAASAQTPAKLDDLGQSKTLGDFQTQAIGKMDLARE